MPIKFKIPLLFLLTIVFSVGIKSFLPEPIKNTELRNEFWLKKTHPSQQYDYVIGGDSRTYRGFSTVDMEKELGSEVEAMNFGYASIGFSAEYLRFLVEQTKENGTIILGISPHSLTKEAVKNEEFHQYHDIGWFEKWKGLNLSKYTKYFAPYKAEEVRDILLGSVSEDQYFETFYPNKGWTKSSRIPEDTLVALDIYERVFKQYQIDTTIQRRLFEQVNYWNNKGYTFYAFRFPTLMSMIALENQLSGFDEAYFIQGFEKAGGHWISIDPHGFHTYDGSHLHYESAIRLAKEVGNFIRNSR
jgi:hypothetical protein